MDQQLKEAARNMLIASGMTEDEVAVIETTTYIQMSQEYLGRIANLVSEVMVDKVAGREFIRTLTELRYDISHKLYETVKDSPAAKSLQSIASREEAVKFALKLYDAIQSSPEEVEKVKKEIAAANEVNKLAANLSSEGREFVAV